MVELNVDRNIFGIVNDRSGNPPLLQMFKIFADYDNYPIGPQAWIQRLKVPIIYIVNGLGKLGTLAEYHSIYKEYTPQRLMGKAQKFGLN
jgi:hypothetical protein